MTRYAKVKGRSLAPMVDSRFVRLLGLAVGALLITACSSAEGTYSAPGGDDDPIIHGGGSNMAGSALTGTCDEGEARRCTYYLPEHNGVRQCIFGFQQCIDGIWSQCIEGDAPPGLVLSDGGLDSGTE